MHTLRSMWNILKHFIIKVCLSKTKVKLISKTFNVDDVLIFRQGGIDCVNAQIIFHMLENAQQDILDGIAEHGEQSAEKSHMLCGMFKGLAMMKTQFVELFNASPDTIINSFNGVNNE